MTIVPDPNDPVAMTGAFGGALRVGVLLQGVLAAVQFDRKFPRRTAKAGDAASAGISTAGR